MKRFCHTHQLFIFTLLVMIFSFSCNLNKKVTTNEAIEVLPEKQLLDSLHNNQLAFSQFKAKTTATVYFKEEKNILKNNIRIKKDSAIWLHLSKGIPILTTLVSQDSVKLLIRVGKKQYFLGEISEINQLLFTDLNYSMLQDYFMGNPVSLDNGKYKASVDHNQYLLSAERIKKIADPNNFKRNRKEKILYQYWINPKNFNCSKLQIHDLDNRTQLTIHYSNWEAINGHLFPYESSIEINSPNDTLKLELKFGKISLEEPLSFPFKIPDNYTPFDSNEME